MSSPELGPTTAFKQATNLIARVLAAGGSLVGLEDRYPNQFAGLSDAERREARQLGRLAEGFRLEVVGLAGGEAVGSVGAQFAPFRLGNVALLEGETISGYLERTGRQLGGRFEVIFRERRGSERDPAHPQYREILLSAGDFQTPDSLAAAAFAELEERYQFDVDAQYDLDIRSAEIRYLPFDLH